MAVVVVVVGTDHDDHEDALRAVSNGMKRAGYDVLGYRIEDHPVLTSPDVRAILEVCEPEVNPNGRTN